MVSFGILSEVWCTGGVERQAISLLKHLPPHIQCVGIGLAPGAPTDQATVAETMQFAPVFGTRRFSDCNRDDLRNVRRFEKYEQVLDRFGHCDVLMAWSNTRIPEWFTGRVVAISHGCVDWTRSVLAGMDSRATDRVAVSRAAARSFPVHRQSEVTVIHNGIEFDRLTPCEDWRTARFDLGVDEHECLVAYVGRFSEEKDPLAAARAVRGLRNQGVAATALYVGIGFDQGQTQELVKQITGGHAIFLPVNDVARAYNIANVVMCCSPLEGFGLTRVEAMATGVPLVCTRTGIIPEIEEQMGECCEIVRNPQNDGELTWAVLQAMESIPRTSAARSFAWEHLSAKRMAMNWSRFLEDICGKAGGTTEHDSGLAVSGGRYQRA